MQVRQNTDRGPIIMSGMFEKYRRALTLLAAMAVMAGLTLVVFADVLFCSSQTVLSKRGCDLASLFIPLRSFAIKELLSGHLPLWNPYLQSGLPYFGQFETALFYPLSFIYMILPLAKAINATVALHTFLSGLFMYLWARHRKLHPVAAVLAGVILMFCGARYAHISAGHLSNLTTMTWAPLLFLALDGLFDKPGMGWVFLGTAASSLMILAGHPQYVYFTGLAAIIYCVLCLVHCQHRKPVLMGLAGIGVAAFGIVAIKLLTGLEVAQESVRSGGMGRDFAHICSFPLESFITLLCPYFFGNSSGSVAYWGRWFWWEMCLFTSVSAVLLAVYAVSFADKASRRFSITMIVIMLIFSMGGYLPLFSLTLKLIPGFGMFRGHGKFIFQASLFIIMLASIGLDHLIRHGPPKKSGFAVLLVIPCLLLLAVIVLGLPAFNFQPGGFWSDVQMGIQSTYESHPRMRQHGDPAFQEKAAVYATWGLIAAGGTGFAFVGLVAAARRWPRAIYGTAGLAAVELLVCAGLSRPTFELEDLVSPEMAAMEGVIPQDNRVLFCGEGLQQMAMNVYGIWGSEVVSLKRYAEFIAFTQGFNPDDANESMKVRKPHPLWLLLRCKYVILPQKGEYELHVFQEEPLPQLLLVNRYRLLEHRDDIFAAMSAPDFDPFKEVVLEKDPQLPQTSDAAAGGVVRIVDSAAGVLTIEADLPEPAMLINTSSYSKGWRAVALEGSAQSEYEVMPANYVLRGIPLSAGRHMIRLEYMPLSYRVGKWVSLVSLLIYFLAMGWWLLRQRGNQAVTVSETVPKPNRRPGKARPKLAGGMSGTC